jgi:CubicO group peptidase (beta-lactamase class C family)
MHAGADMAGPDDSLVAYGALSDVYFSGTSRSGSVLEIDQFGHYGFGGSHLRVVPSRDLVIVVIGERGKDPDAMHETLRAVDRLVELFPIFPQTGTNDEQD